METLLNKDRITEVNPFMFAKIEAKIARHNQSLVPVWSIRMLRLSMAVLFVLVTINIFFGLKTNRQNKAQQSQQAYNEFLQENSLEGLSSMATADMLNQK